MKPIVVLPAGRELAATIVQGIGDAAEFVEADQDEPIRLKFGGKGQGVSKADVTGLKADQQVSSLDGRAYDGDRATGRLTLMGGSERSRRREAGLSPRQWKKLKKQQRR